MCVSSMHLLGPGAFSCLDAVFFPTYQHGSLKNVKEKKKEFIQKYYISPHSRNHAVHVKNQCLLPLPLCAENVSVMYLL